MEEGHLFTDPSHISLTSLLLHLRTPQIEALVITALTPQSLSHFLLALLRAPTLPVSQLPPGAYSVFNHG